MLYLKIGARSLPSDVIAGEIKKLGEVAFPAQVRSDTYYFYSAAYFYFGSAPFVAFAVPVNKNTIKTISYYFMDAPRRRFVTKVLRK